MIDIAGGTHATLSDIQTLWTGLVNHLATIQTTLATTHIHLIFRAVGFAQVTYEKKVNLNIKLVTIVM